MAKVKKTTDTHIYTNFNMKVRFTDDREGMQGSMGAFIMNNEGTLELDERIRSIKRRAIKAMQKAVDEFNANENNPSTVSVEHNEDKPKSRPSPKEWNSHYYLNK